MKTAVWLVWSSLLVTQVSPSDALETSNLLFHTNCAPCHGKDGRAKTPVARKLGVKDLARSRISEEEIARQIRDGRKDPQGKQKMPAFGDRLTPKEVTELVQVVKEFRR